MTSDPLPADAAPSPPRPRAGGRRTLWPLAISLTVHVLGLGAGVWLYVAEPPSTPAAPLKIQLAEIIESRHVDPDPLPLPDPVEPFERPEDTELPEDPILPPDTPLDDPVLLEEARPAPQRPPLQLLAEVPIRAVKVRVKVAPPPPPPAPAAPAEPRAAPRKPPGRPLRITFRPDLRLYYPREMQLRGIEGTSLVGIAVSRAGRVTSAWIVRSSGWPLLDRQALRVMYDHRFARGDGGRARVPVAFQLE